MGIYKIIFCYHDSDFISGSKNNYCFFHKFFLLEDGNKMCRTFASPLKKKFNMYICKYVTQLPWSFTINWWIFLN